MRTDTWWLVAVGACFAPAVVATVIYLGVHASDLNDQRTESSKRWLTRAATWTVYGITASVAVGAAYVATHLI